METVLCWLHQFWVKRDERKQLLGPDPAKVGSLHLCDHPILDEKPLDTVHPETFLLILHQSAAQAPQQLMYYAGFFPGGDINGGKEVISFHDFMELRSFWVLYGFFFWLPTIRESYKSWSS